MENPVCLHYGGSKREECVRIGRELILLDRLSFILYKILTASFFYAQMVSYIDTNMLYSTYKSLFFYS